MNENLNLVEILKYCPEGTKLYSTVYGDVELVRVYLDVNTYPIEIKIDEGSDMIYITNDGRLFDDFRGECTLFPSKDQRDWSKFKIKKPKFDPKTLKPFDKVLVRDFDLTFWSCQYYSHIIPHIIKVEENFPYMCVYHSYKYCIPYNEDTKHLVGTTKEAPEYYRYWEE